MAKTLQSSEAGGSSGEVVIYTTDPSKAGPQSSCVSCVPAAVPRGVDVFDSCSCAASSVALVGFWCLAGLGGSLSPLH